VCWTVPARTGGSPALLSGFSGKIRHGGRATNSPESTLAKFFSFPQARLLFFPQKICTGLNRTKFVYALVLPRFCHDFSLTALFTNLLTPPKWFKINFPHHKIQRILPESSVRRFICVLTGIWWLRHEITLPRLKTS
jgi:hypothetical protein